MAAFTEKITSGPSPTEGSRHISSAEISDPEWLRLGPRQTGAAEENATKCIIAFSVGILLTRNPYIDRRRYQSVSTLIAMLLLDRSCH
jgi:hypothetical protein